MESKSLVKILGSSMLLPSTKTSSWPAGSGKPCCKMLVQVLCYPDAAYLPGFSVPENHLLPY